MMKLQVQHLFLDPRYKDHPQDKRRYRISFHIEPVQGHVGLKSLTPITDNILTLDEISSFTGIPKLLLESTIYKS